MQSPQNEPKLAAPGAGISKVELLVLNTIIKPIVFRNSGLGSAIASIKKSSAQLIAASRAVAEDSLTRRVLVSRNFYIEDSSRFWSTAMLFRHLTKVNAAVTKALNTGVSIKADVLPAPSVRVAAVKPEVERNHGSEIAEFQKAIETLTGTALEKGETSLSRCEIPHPWMGDISHLQWLRFIAFHHRVHLTQLKNIVRGLKENV